MSPSLAFWINSVPISSLHCRFLSENYCSGVGRHVNLVKMSDQQLFHPISEGIRLDLPVSVVLRQRTIQRGRWSVPVWELEAVALGAQAKLSDGQGALIRQTDTEKSYAWTGWNITLYKDACERYWHALIGDKPLVYVVCRDPLDDESALSTEPLLVSVDYDEATAFLETDDTVLSMPIPADIYRHMEAFVLQHYKPKPFKKRKRKKWVDGEVQGWSPMNDETSTLSRWSKRKHQVEAEKLAAKKSVVEIDEGATAAPGVDMQYDTASSVADLPDVVVDAESTDPHSTAELEAVEEALLTDEDMPEVSSLTSESDISMFFNRGVSKTVRNAALKYLFQLPKYNIRDGLNDYDEDYTYFEPLGDTVTCDMKFHTERKEREAREAEEALLAEQEEAARAEEQAHADTTEDESSETSEESAQHDEDAEDEADQEPDLEPDQDQNFPDQQPDNQDGVEDDEAIYADSQSAIDQSKLTDSTADV